jgi:hypothetical protein
VPALQTYIIEPIWEQFAALLPERIMNHPLGCHRPRVPDRVVFEKLVQVLVFRLRLLLEDRRRGVFGYYASGPAKPTWRSRWGWRRPGDAFGSPSSGQPT